jgi:hypothetical protein
MGPGIERSRRRFTPAEGLRLAMFSTNLCESCASNLNQSFMIDAGAGRWIPRPFVHCGGFPMAAPVLALRLFANGSGASCFESFEISRHLRDFAPPAAPLWSSDIAPASGYTVVRLPIGWNGEKHPTPKRFLLFGLQGRMRITPDVGEPRIIAAGDVLLMEDTTGAGHFTEVVSEVPFDAVMIQLPEISN